MKRKLLITALCLSMVCTLFAGCGKKGEESNDTEINSEAVTESDTAAETEESREGMKRSVLTGEWVDEAIAAKQPVAIMIENTKAAIPQYGITQADVIYECPVEGGITRLMAIFQNYEGMERIGNIRSCRPYYAYIAQEYDAFYLHAGASKQGDEVLSSGIVKDVNANAGKGSSYFYRSEDERKAPHNLYISSDGIAKAIEALGFDAAITEDYKQHNQFAKDDEPVLLESGADAKVVKLYFFDNKPWFEYNDEEGLYYRYEFKKAQVDAAFEEAQVKVKNIILQYIDNTIFSEKLGTLNIDMTSGGAGKYITNGKCIDITWVKEADNITRYYDADGNEIVLNQGKTWISFVQNPYVEKNQYFASVEEYQASLNTTE